MKGRNGLPEEPFTQEKHPQLHTHSCSSNTKGILEWAAKPRDSSSMTCPGSSKGFGARGRKVGKKVSRGWREGAGVQDFKNEDYLKKAIWVNINTTISLVFFFPDRFAVNYMDFIYILSESEKYTGKGTSLTFAQLWNSIIQLTLCKQPKGRLFENTSCYTHNLQVNSMNSTLETVSPAYFSHYRSANYSGV